MSHVTVSGFVGDGGRDKVSRVTVTMVWWEEGLGILGGWVVKGKCMTCNVFCGFGKARRKGKRCNMYRFLGFGFLGFEWGKGQGAACNGFWGLVGRREKVSHVTVSEVWWGGKHGVTCMLCSVLLSLGFATPMFSLVF